MGIIEAIWVSLGSWGYFRGYVKGIHIAIIVLMVFFVCFSLIKGYGSW